MTETRTFTPFCSRTWCTSLACAAVLLLPTGCRTLPDFGPFTETTLQLETAVAAVGDEVESPLRTTGMDTQADNFATAWAAREATMSALSEYVVALQAVVDAGKNGAERAGELATSLTSLAKTAGLPEAGAAGAIADVATKVYGHIAAVRAAKELSEILEASDAAVQEIGRLLAADLSAAREIVKAAQALHENQLTTEYNDALSERKPLAQALAALRTELDSARNGGQPIEPIVSAIDGYEALAEQNQVRVQEFETHRFESRRSAREAVSLIQSAERAVVDWAEAHARLTAATNERRPPSVADLVSTASDLRALIQKVRDR